MRIVSYDVASKSLAIAVLQFNENLIPDIEDINTSFVTSINTLNNTSTGDSRADAAYVCRTALEHINRLYTLMDTLIQPIFLDVVDLIPGKKVSETDVVTRASRLRGYLSYIDDHVLCDKTPVTKILLEYQMGPNDKSRNVGSQILYHHAPADSGFKNTREHVDTIDNSRVSIEIVGPSLKNKLNLVKGGDHQSFIHQYTKTYTANKKHSIANMTHWLSQKGALGMIAGIKKSNHDDIADAITMALAWIHLRSGVL